MSDKICGKNPTPIPAGFVGCGKPINGLSYRCTHCNVEFHKECANAHFRDAEVSDQLIEAIEAGSNSWEHRIATLTADLALVTAERDAARLTTKHEARRADLAEAERKSLEDSVVLCMKSIKEIGDERDALRVDAERWRQCIVDGEFPKGHRGEFLHVCRTTGNINTGSAAEVVDAAIVARGRE